MKDSVKNYLSFCQEVAEATEQALVDYFAKSSENLQFPTLVTTVSTLIKCDVKTVGDVDQQVRQYVRRHDDYHVSRGAKGGIMPRASYDKRQAAKKQILAQVDAKVAAATAPVSTDNLADDLAL